MRLSRPPALGQQTDRPVVDEHERGHGKREPQEVAGRAQLGLRKHPRLLDPSNTAVTLTTLAKASKALGLELQLSFKDTRTDG